MDTVNTTTTTKYRDKDNARFAALTKEAPNGCRLWTGATAGSRYKHGHFRHGSKVLRAHRVAWEMAHGLIPPGLIVRHRCPGFNPLCVNPDHLRLGTHADNRDDQYVDWTMQKPDAPLTDGEREYIRAWVDDHGGTAGEAAHGLGGVHLGTVTAGLRLARKERKEALAIWFVAVLAWFRSLPADVPAIV